MKIKMHRDAVSDAIGFSGSFDPRDVRRIRDPRTQEYLAGIEPTATPAKVLFGLWLLAAELETGKTKAEREQV